MTESADASSEAAPRWREWTRPLMFFILVAFLTWLAWFLLWHRPFAWTVPRVERFLQAELPPGTPQSKDVELFKKQGFHLPWGISVGCPGLFLGGRNVAEIVNVREEAVFWHLEALILEEQIRIFALFDCEAKVIRCVVLDDRKWS